MIDVQGGEKSRHSLLSSMREEYVEYIFLGALCQVAWTRSSSLEILRSTTDAYGYDLVLGMAGLQRQVQLKASLVGGRTAGQPINRALGRQPSGCIVWLLVEDADLSVSEILWFGGRPDESLALPDRVVKHTKGDPTGVKAVRPNMTRVNRGEFERLETYGALLDRMFGPPAQAIEAAA